MAELCYDSYDALVSNAEISGLESDQWLAVKGMDPWDPAAAREQCAQAFNDCANNHFDNGSYDDALSCYTRALGIMPNYSWALCNRATVHLARDDIDAAYADYTAAIEIDPNDTAVFNGRAFAGLRAAAVKDAGTAQATLQRALEDVDKALTLDDRNGPAHCTRGAILKQLALGVANGATDKAAAAVAGAESEKEWTRLIEGAIAAQRAAIRLEPEAQEPRDYLRELLAMLGINEEVADVEFKSVWESARRSVPAPQSDETGQRRKEGWLHKKGGLKDGERNWIKGGKRNWKARWVAVEERCIRWYDVKGGKELGNVQLTVFAQVEIDADNANKFCVRTPDRDLWLKAEDEASASEWMASIVANLS